MFKKLASSISGIFLLLSALNIISRVLGFFREMVFAFIFGTQKEFDVYLVASVIPTTISTIILYIGQNYFIPAYNSYKKFNDKNDGFFKLNIQIFFLLGILITALLFIFNTKIIELFISPNDNHLLFLASSVFRILIVVLPLNAVISIIIAYYQAEIEFIIPAVSRLFLNLTIIPIVFFSSQNMGVYSISVGISAGILIQFLYLIIKLKIKEKWNLKSYFNQQSKLGQNFTYTIVGIVIIESVSQLYSVSDRFFYTSVDDGGIAALNYAMTIYSLPINIISISISSIIFSKVAEYFTSAHSININKFVSEFLRVNFIIFFFTTFYIFVFGEDLVKIIFERGRFESSDTLSTFNLLKIYSISLIFYSTYSLYNKILYSAKLIKPLLIITLIGVLIKVIFNFVLVEQLKQEGLALSTVISFFFFFASSNIIVRNRLNIKSDDNFLILMFYYLINLLISYCIVLLVTTFVSLTLLLHILLIMIIFIIVFIVNLTILNDHVIDYLLKAKSLL